MTSAQGTFTNPRFPAWTIAAVAAATFAIGLVAGLGIPRDASHSSKLLGGAAVGAAGVVSAAGTSAAAIQAYQAYRAEERDGR